MIKKSITIFATLILGLMITSCEKIESQDYQTETIDFSANMEDIPLQYGKLVSATSAGQHVNMLWFEKADKTIVGVRVNTSRGTASEAVITFERK
jgi:hypothetical protein